MAATGKTQQGGVETGDQGAVGLILEDILPIGQHIVCAENPEIDRASGAGSDRDDLRGTGGGIGWCHGRGEWVSRQRIAKEAKKQWESYGTIGIDVKLK
jgi:hypothetical protein